MSTVSERKKSEQEPKSALFADGSQAQHRSNLLLQSQNDSMSETRSNSLKPLKEEHSGYAVDEKGSNK